MRMYSNIEQLNAIISTFKELISIVHYQIFNTTSTFPQPTTNNYNSLQYNACSTLYIKRQCKINK